MRGMDDNLALFKIENNFFPKLQMNNILILFDSCFIWWSRDRHGFYGNEFRWNCFTGKIYLYMKYQATGHWPEVELLIFHKIKTSRQFRLPFFLATLTIINSIWKSLLCFCRYFDKCPKSLSIFFPIA